MKIFLFVYLGIGIATSILVLLFVLFDKPSGHLDFDDWLLASFFIPFWPLIPIGYLKSSIEDWISDYKYNKHYGRKHNENNDL